jgi:hypothetical protein
MDWRDRQPMRKINFTFIKFNLEIPRRLKEFKE